MGRAPSSDHRAYLGADEPAQPDRSADAASYRPSDHSAASAAAVGHGYGRGVDSSSVLPTAQVYRYANPQHAWVRLAHTVPSPRPDHRPAPGQARSTSAQDQSNTPGRARSTSVQDRSSTPGQDRSTSVQDRSSARPEHRQALRVRDDAAAGARADGGTNSSEHRHTPDGGDDEACIPEARRSAGVDRHEPSRTQYATREAYACEVAEPRSRGTAQAVAQAQSGGAAQAAALAKDRGTGNAAASEHNRQMSGTEEPGHDADYPCGDCPGKDAIDLRGLKAMGLDRILM